MRILLAIPAYWPAHAFGGPVVVARELVSRLVAHGHEVHVVTTTLRDVGERASSRTAVATVDGATVTYLGTPLRYRWMGITPTLPLALRRLARPDVAHVLGFRDPVTTGVAAWCRLRRVPYVFEGMGMVAPKHRKVLLKRALEDARQCRRQPHPAEVQRRREVVNRDAVDVLATRPSRNGPVVGGEARREDLDGVTERHEAFGQLHHHRDRPAERMRRPVRGNREVDA